MEKLLSEWKNGLVDKEVYLVGKRDYKRKKAREAKTQEQVEGSKQREEKKG